MPPSPDQVGVVCHVKVVTDKVPDMTNLETWKKAFIKEGMTDEQTPTPIPAPRRSGLLKAGRAPAMPTGVMTTTATSIEAPSPSMPPPVRETRWARMM